MCIRCALAAVLSTVIAEMPAPKFVGVDFAQDQPEKAPYGNNNPAPPVNHQAEASQEPDKATEAQYATGRHLNEGEGEYVRRLERRLARVSEQNDKSRATHEAMRGELARVTELAMKFQEESRIATEMVKMLVKGQQP